MRAFEQNALAFALMPVEELPHRVDIRRDLGRDRCQLLEQFVAVDFRLRKPAPQRVVMDQRTVDLRGQRLEILQIDHVDRATSDLVFIGGADAAFGGADRARAGRILAQRVELAGASEG